MCPTEEKCRYYHIKICRKKKEIINDDKKDANSEKALRDKITKELKDKKEKEMREKIIEEMKSKKEGEKSEKSKNSNPTQDFQKGSVKEPDIMTILLTLQSQVS